MSTDTSRSSGEPERRSDTHPIVIDGISYIPSSVLLTGIPKVSFKEDHCFAVVDTQGQIGTRWALVIHTRTLLAPPALRNQHRGPGQVQRLDNHHGLGGMGGSLSHLE